VVVGISVVQSFDVVLNKSSVPRFHRKNGDNSILSLYFTVIALPKIITISDRTPKNYTTAIAISKIIQALIYQIPHGIKAGLRYKTYV
jgi:hypothetical protein